MRVWIFLSVVQFYLGLSSAINFSERNPTTRLNFGWPLNSGKDNRELPNRDDQKVAAAG